MKTSLFSPAVKALGLGLGLGAAVLLAGCSFFSSKADAPKPLALPANPQQVSVQLAWQAAAGAQNATTGMSVQQGQVLVSSSDGSVTVLNSQGQVAQRVTFGAPLSTAAGFDGQRLAAVTNGDELLVFAQGKEMWRQRLPAQSYTAPVVAGGRVFALLADRSVMAFDGDNGARLWHLKRSGGQQQDPLILREAGVFLPMGDTLVVGVGPRLQGIDPDRGELVWDKAVATPRGTNDVERLADLVVPAFRSDAGVVCARAYQAGVACVNTKTQELLWRQASLGSVGVAGDATRVFGTQSDGRVQAWGSRGESLWVNEQLLFRRLTAPAVWGGRVVLGDAEGTLYVLNAQTGALMDYQKVGGAGVKAVATVGDTLLVLTHAGEVLAYRS